MQRKQFIAKKFDNILCEVAALVANDMSPPALGTLVQTWRSLCSIAFFHKSGHVESLRYADGEIVGLVHASRRESDVTYM